MHTLNLETKQNMRSLLGSRFMRSRLISSILISVCIGTSGMVYATSTETESSLQPRNSSDAQHIINRSERAAYYAGDDGKTQARMLIVDAQGRKQMRQFTILRKDVEDGGDQKMLVFFSRPSDVSGMVFRVEKHSQLNKDDDRWLYLPGLDMVKRISAGDKRTSFVGSHFFYEDVSGRSISQDQFELITTTDTSFILEGRPVDDSNVEFKYYIVTIDKQTYLPMKIDFYNNSDKHYRRVESLEVKTVDGIPTVLKSKVTDVNNGGYTLMEFRGVKYNLGLPDMIFGERSLRTPPVEWLRR